MLVARTENTTAFPGESKDLSVREIGSESRLVTVIRILKSTKKRSEVSNFNDNTIDAAHLIYTGSMTFSNSVLSTSLFSNSRAFVSIW